MTDDRGNLIMPGDRVLVTGHSRDVPASMHGSTCTVVKVLRTRIRISYQRGQRDVPAGLLRVVVAADGRELCTEWTWLQLCELAACSLDSPMHAAGEGGAVEWLTQRLAARGHPVPAAEVQAALDAWRRRDVATVTLKQARQR